MAENIQFGLNVNSNEPLDNRSVAATTSARDELITDDLAYEGQLVYVEAENKTYVLTVLGSDIASSTWTEVGATETVESWNAATLTANGTLQNNYIYILDADNLRLNLPRDPEIGDELYISNLNQNEGVDLLRNGSNIMGLNEDMELDNPNASFSLVYTGSANSGWVVIGSDGGSTSTTTSSNANNSEVGTKTLSSSDGTIELFAVNVIPDGTSSLSITIPTSITNGDWFEIANLSGETTNTIDRGSFLIQGESTNLALDDASASFRMTFINATTGWVITGAN